MRMRLRVEQVLVLLKQEAELRIRAFVVSSDVVRAAAVTRFEPTKSSKLLRQQRRTCRWEMAVNLRNFGPPFHKTLSFFILFSFIF